MRVTRLLQGCKFLRGHEPNAHVDDSLMFDYVEYRSFTMAGVDSGAVPSAAKSSAFLVPFASDSC